MENKAADNEDVKGFNDSELEDIMNEIENLENDLAAESSEPENQVLESKVQNNKDEAPPQNGGNVVNIASVIGSHIPEVESSLNLKVEGKLGVNFSFNIGPNTVTLKIEESGLTIEMQNGAKFTIPLEDIKKSA